MPEMNFDNKDRKAVICYCTLWGEYNSHKINPLLYKMQELMENMGFREIEQAFITGMNLPVTVPFDSYPQGYRVRIREEESGCCFVENLVLSYGLLRDYFANNKNKKNEKYYLVLLRDGDYPYEEELEGILGKIRELKEEQNITVYCLSTGECYTAWEMEIAACGEKTVKAVL